ARHLVPLRPVPRPALADLPAPRLGARAHPAGADAALPPRLLRLPSLPQPGRGARLVTRLRRRPFRAAAARLGRPPAGRRRPLRDLARLGLRPTAAQRRRPRLERARPVALRPLGLLDRPPPRAGPGLILRTGSSAAPAGRTGRRGRSPAPARRRAAGSGAGR